MKDSGRINSSFLAFSRGMTQLMDVQPHIHQLQQWLNQQIIGQQDLVERLLITLLADGHLLVEGSTRPGKNQGDKNPRRWY